jgi:hypothetical protein
MEPVTTQPSTSGSDPSETPASVPAADAAGPQEAFPPISGPLRPANEVLLEQLSPTSPVFRRRAFASMLRVLLAGKGD